MRNARFCTLTPGNNPMAAFHVLLALQEKGLRPLRNQQGVTYLALMFFVVIIGLSLMAVNQHWSVILKRDREKELAFRGNRVKAAIERYAADFEVQKATRQNRYPLKLEELTKRPKRYLQMVYKDPITGEDFALIKRGAEIRGVRSTSLDSPLDQVTFQEAEKYHDIRFEAVITDGATKTEVETEKESKEKPTTSYSRRPVQLIVSAQGAGEVVQDDRYRE